MNKYIPEKTSVFTDRSFYKKRDGGMNLLKVSRFTGGVTVIDGFSILFHFPVFSFGYDAVS